MCQRLSIGAFVCIASLVGLGAQANPITLVDGSSQVTIDPASELGMTSWTINGVNQLERQWFWFRIGAQGGEQSIDKLSANPFVGLTDINFDGNQETAYLRYTGVQLKAEVTYTLTGSSPGLFSSDIAEVIRLTNVSTQSLDLHFFQYCDLNLGGTVNDQWVRIDGNNTARQQDVGAYVGETVVTPLPTARQVGFVPTILNLLDDNLPTTLNGDVGPIGPGDLSWAFEWDVTLAPNGTLLVSKDKQIVPEPGALALLAVGALAAIRRRTA